MLAVLAVVPVVRVTVMFPVEVEPVALVDEVLSVGVVRVTVMFFVEGEPLVVIVEMSVADEVVERVIPVVVFACGHGVEAVVDGVVVVDVVVLVGPAVVLAVVIGAAVVTAAVVSVAVVDTSKQ